jgi:hypothetical protein
MESSCDLSDSKIFVGLLLLAITLAKLVTNAVAYAVGKNYCEKGETTLFDDFKMFSPYIVCVVTLC